MNQDYIEAMSAALGLDIRPEWRDGVAEYLAVAARMAALVEQAPVQEDEAAPVFRP
ncbi:MAG: DUF4089 domain-containing protein [Alphaproteobacteria bacterium]|nr:DUF4089 domain-containing protein [Alphaproteobacteria bacterium]